MSGIAKAVKKVWRPIERLGSKITNVATLGLHNKTKKIRHKIIKSKIFKVVVAAAAIYFGGAALLSMAGGGTASAGIGSAWAGAQGAGSALMAGNFSGAASALGSGFTGGAAAGATGTFAAGQAATQGVIQTNLANAAATAAGSTAGATLQSATPSLSTTAASSTPSVLNSGASVGLANAPTYNAALSAEAAAIGSGASAAPSGGLLAGLGEAGKAALITGAINTGGQMIQGYAQQKAAEEEKENRNYYGVDGKGNATSLPSFGGLLDPARLNPLANANPVPQLQPVNTLDDLIARQKQQVKQWG